MQPKPKAPDPTKPAELGKPLNPPAQVFRVRFSPDGKVLAAACSDGTVRRWDVAGKEPAELPPLAGHNGWVTGLAFNSRQMFTTDSWGRLTAWDLDGKQTWTVEAAHAGWARGVATDPTLTLVATCGKDGFVRQWGAAKGTPDVEWKVGADVLSVAFGPADHRLFAGDLLGVVREYDYAMGKPGRTFEAKELYKLDRIQDVGGVRCLLTDAAGKTLFVGGAVPTTGGFVQCTPLVVAFDLATGKRLSQWKGANDNEGYVTDMAWHPDGYVVATASGQPGQGKVFFWKPGDPQPFFTAPKPNCHSVAIHPDGTRIAASMTNANSSGNGRVKGKDNEYPANFSPIQLWQVPRA